MIDLPEFPRDPNSYQSILTWRPSWSAHQFSVVGEDVQVERYRQHYDSGRNEGPVSQLIRDLDYQLLVDVGAGFGLYPAMRLQARPGTEVVAIEADPLRYGICVKNLLPYGESCKVIWGTVGPLQHHDAAPGKMVCYRKQDGPVLHETTIPLADLLADSSCKTLVKIDVEGAEAEILRGQGALMANPAFQWIVEVHSWGTESAETICQWFRDADREIDALTQAGGSLQRFFVH